MGAVDVARQFIGVPYLHQGRTEYGLDCVGLLCKVADSLGIEYEDIPVYSRTSPKHYAIEEVLSRYAIPVEDELQLGDVLVFWIRSKKYPQHCGIISNLDPVSFIHTHSGVGRTVEHPTNEWWDKRIRSRWRF